MKKIVLFLIFNLIAQIINPVFVFAEEDLQAPALTAFEISPKVVNTNDGDQLITLTFSATDNLSGIKYASLEMKSSDETEELEFDDFYNTSDSETSGTYSIVGILPKGSIAGEWSVHFFNLEDWVGNNVFFNIENLEAQFGAGSATINNILDSVRDPDVDKSDEDLIVDFENKEGDLTIKEISIPKPALSFSGKIKEAVFSSEKKNYIGNDKVKFKGELKGAANGKVIIKYKGADKGEEVVEIDNNGDWSKKVKFDRNGDYRVKFIFFDKDNQELGKKGYYQINIDNKDPKIEDLPARVSKHNGDKVWWNAVDKEKIDEYKYYFNGKKIKTKNQFFYISQGTPKGEYLLEIRAYDKAGNKDIKNMWVKVI